MTDSAATRIEQLPGVVVVRIQPERLDESNIAAIRSEVAAAGGESPQLPVVLDMARVNFMPSLSLGGLVQLAALFKSRSQRLVLANLQQPVREILAITRLDRLFELQDNLSSFTGARS